MEQLLEELPKVLNNDEKIYRSFIYQPERLSVNSRQSLKNPNLQDGLSFQSDYYNTFTSELKNPLLRVQSMELLRITIPNSLPSLPISETVFYYYRIPASPSFPYLPLYSQMDVDHIHMVRLLSPFVYSPDNYVNRDSLGFNKTFEDYDDLVTQLNKSATLDPNFTDPDWVPLQPYPAQSIVFYNSQRWFTEAGSAGEAIFNADGAWAEILTPFLPGDITFIYDTTLNKIVVQGNNYEYDAPAGQPKNYYLPVGYGDPNLQLFINRMREPVYENGALIGGGDLNSVLFPSYEDYTLNRRLGFLWDGVYEPDPPTDSLSYVILFNHTFPKPNYPAVPLIFYTAESYADLVYSANFFVYCDVVGGSTQDTNADERLLAVVPVNASTLGIAYGESKISCLLTKVSQYVNQITFSIRDDKGELIYFPKNSYINVELKINYF